MSSTKTGDIVRLLHDLTGHLNGSESGRRFTGDFDAAIQFRWVSAPVDPKNMAWFGSEIGSWASLETNGGQATLISGDVRSERDWRRCILIESDEETLGAVLNGTLRPLDAYLGDRLHVSHFTVAWYGWPVGHWRLSRTASPDGRAGVSSPGAKRSGS